MSDIDIDKLREFFLDPEGWQYEYIISQGQYLFKPTKIQDKYIIHYIPSDPAKKHDRPIMICDARDIYEEGGVINAPSPVKIDLGHLKIDDMSQEYFDFLETVTNNGLEILKDVV